MDPFVAKIKRKRMTLKTIPLDVIMKVLSYKLHDDLPLAEINRLTGIGNSNLKKVIKLYGPSWLKKNPKPELRGRSDVLNFIHNMEDLSLT